MKDGRSFIVETIRAVPSQRLAIIGSLSEVIKCQGSELLDQICSLQNEIEHGQIEESSTIANTSEDTSASEASTENKEKKFQLTTLELFTKKDNQARKLLVCLNILRNNISIFLSEIT